ncbi:S8 family serine peptidase [bacterium]|nr:S8 family serine peptidase [bacterium]
MGFRFKLPGRMAIVLSATLLLSACGSSDGDLQPRENQALPSHRAAWLQLEQSPGIAGQDYDPRRILVSYKAGASLPSGWTRPAGKSAAASQPNASLRQDKSYEALTDALVLRYGLTIRQQVYLPGLSYASFELPQEADGAALLARIRREAGSMLEAAVFSPMRHSSATPNDPAFQDGFFGDMWSHYMVNCPQAWNLTTGVSSVIIAVVDTGVNLHEDLGGQVINPATEFPSANCDVVNNDKTVEDQDGHGTFIAGVVAADGNNFTAGAGVAYHCRVLPIKIANGEGGLVDDTVAGALLADQLGAQVINYSWGGPDLVPIEQSMVNTVTNNGRLFVCAAGNDGVSTDEYPSVFANALSVGATNSNDVRASFSNWGPAVDIAAPGESLLGLAHDDPFGYWYIDGTSFAAPMVAAAAGLLWSLDSGLTLSEVRTALVSTGPSLTGFSSPIRRLDIEAAMDSVFVPATPTITALNPTGGTTLGAVVGQTLLQASVVGPQNVVRVEYRLDLAPLGVDGAEDLTAESTVLPGGFAAELDISALNNQLAQLKAEYFSSLGSSGQTTSQPIWIFKQRGDVDGDGVVGPDDLAALSPVIGAQQGQGGYLRYADSDLDGSVTEADAAAIGYFYGAGAPVPVINDVQPRLALAATQVSFSADVSGSGQLDYAWDFGGGATPNTSSDPAPTVSLGAEGTYSASLTLSDPFRSVRLDFDLVLQDVIEPTAVISATPLSGFAPLVVDFEGSGSFVPGGSIVSYSWSWDGDEVWESEGTNSDAVHQFTTEGTYTVRLEVTDNRGEKGQATVDIEVLGGIDNWVDTELGPWGSGNSADNNRLACGEVAGCPAVVWGWDDPSGFDLTLYVAVASTPTPLSIADWRVDTITTGDLYDSYGICDAGGEAGFIFQKGNQLYFGSYDGASHSEYVMYDGAGAGLDNATLANIGGEPAVLFRSFGGSLGQGMAYGYASVGDPSSSGQWTLMPCNSVPPADTPYSYAFNLFDVGGKPAFNAGGIESGTTLFAFSNNVNTTANTWASVTFPGTHTGSELFSYGYEVAGRAALVFNNRSDAAVWTLNYAAANSDEPAQTSDWTLHQPLAPDNPSIRMGGLVGGLPAFGWNDAGETQVALAQVAQPASTADWLVISLPNNKSGNRRIADHDGLPSLFAVTNGQVVYRYPQ